MAGRQRRQREQAGTRANILAAALALAQEEGWPGVTMRKIAGRIDYTHAALYAYFATKDDLLLALFRDSTDLLVAALEGARASSPDQAATLLAIGRAYWDFAWENPAHYQLLNGLGGVSLAVPETITEGRRAEAVVAAVLQGQDAPHDSLAASDRVTILWATLHGLVSLGLAGRLTREHGALLVAQVARNVLGGWAIPSPADWDAPIADQTRDPTDS